MKATKIAESHHTQWIMFGRDAEKPEKVIDTNQYLIKHNNRAILLDPLSRDMDPLAELLLYTADRAQHIKEYILPLLSDLASTNKYESPAFLTISA